MVQQPMATYLLGMTPLEINLRQYRERKGLSQAALGKLAGVRQATISDLENGKGRRVDLDVLERIAKVLGVKATALLSERRGRE
jgi:transcriptional regulator with XRE-family HTH domain